MKKIDRSGVKDVRLLDALNHEDDRFGFLRAVEVAFIELSAAEQKRLWPRLLKARRSAARALAVTEGVRAKIKKRPAIDGGSIKAAREGLGETQAEFAKRFGVGALTVSRWERGAQLPENQMIRVGLLELIEKG